jgi:hypothetical protein
LHHAGKKLEISRIFLEEVAQKIVRIDLELNNGVVYCMAVPLAASWGLSFRLPQAMGI